MNTDPHIRTAVNSAVELVDEVISDPLNAAATVFDAIPEAVEAVPVIIEAAVETAFDIVDSIFGF